MMFLLSGGIACAGSLLYQPETESLIRNVVMALAGTGIVIYAYLFSETAGLFIYRNEGKYDKFAVVYLGSMIAAIFFPWLPVTGWPFLVIFVLLGVFSNGITGMMAGSVCLLLAVNFAGGDLSVFWLYFISGLAGILMFSNLNDDFLVGLPVIVSLLVLILCLTANVVLFSREQLAVEQFTIPAMNMMICCILLLVILKAFSSSVIHKDQEKYMEINDPECPLLVQLKNSNNHIACR